MLIDSLRSYLVKEHIVVPEDYTAHVRWDIAWDG